MTSATNPLTVHVGDALTVLRTLPSASVQCCVTSPPYYGLRNYDCAGQMGSEATPEAFVEALVAVFREVRRVLMADGTCWINLGDSYANDAKWGGRTGGKHVKALHGSAVGRDKRCTGLKPKDLIGIPWLTAFALRADGWYLRQDIIWHKPNPMPESVTDRCTKAHEYLFLLSKSERYYYDAEAIKEQTSPNTNPRKAGNGYKTPDGWDTSTGEGGHGSFHKNGRGKGAIKELVEGQANIRKARDASRKHGEAGLIKNNESFDAAMAIMPEMRNKRSVWTVPTFGFAEAHFATYPPDLIRPCILAGTRQGDTVLDPFGGSGTTGMVALELGRRAVLIELNAEYAKIIARRTDITPGLAL